MLLVKSHHKIQIRQGFKLTCLVLRYNLSNVAGMDNKATKHKQVRHVGLEKRGTLM